MHKVHCPQDPARPMDTNKTVPHRPVPQDQHFFERLAASGKAEGPCRWRPGTMHKAHWPQDPPRPRDAKQDSTTPAGTARPALLQATDVSRTLQTKGYQTRQLHSGRYCKTGTSSSDSRQWEGRRTLQREAGGGAQSSLSSGPSKTKGYQQDSSTPAGTARLALLEATDVSRTLQTNGYQQDSTTPAGTARPALLQATDASRTLQREARNAAQSSLSSGPSKTNGYQQDSSTVTSRYCKTGTSSSD